MLYILPITEISRSLHSQTQYFVQEHDLDGDALTYSKCEAVVIAFIYKILAGRLLWLDYVNPSEVDMIVKDLVGLMANYTDVKIDFTEVMNLEIDKLIDSEAEYAKALGRLFDWFILSGQDQEEALEEGRASEIVLSNEYNTTVVEDIWYLLCQQISEIIPEKTWKVWTLCRLGRDLYLKEGEDYRIIDWMKNNKGE